MYSLLQLAMFISGGGTTAREIIRAAKSGRLTGINPGLVIASRHDAGGIEKAKAEGIPVEIMRPRDYDTPEAYGEALLCLCRNYGIDIIGQYGWMPLTPPILIKAYLGWSINQHPGPLDPGYPDFGGKGMYGTRVHCARLLFARRAGGQLWTEVVSQRVAESFDQGAVLNVRRVPIRPSDTSKRLQRRALPVEHDVQIQTLQMFAADRVVEIVRPERLILPEQFPFLERAKRRAAQLYPHG